MMNLLTICMLVIPLSAIHLWVLLRIVLGTIVLAMIEWAASLILQ